MHHKETLLFQGVDVLYWSYTQLEGMLRKRKTVSFVIFVNIWSYGEFQKNNKV